MRKGGLDLIGPKSVASLSFLYSVQSTCGLLSFRTGYRHIVNYKNVEDNDTVDLAFNLLFPGLSCMVGR